MDRTFRPGWGYRIGAGLALAGVRVAAGLGAKWATRWCSIRLPEARLQLEAATRALPPGTAWRWIHCASVGEYEQALPVIEALKAASPELPVLLTAFSPSLAEPLAARRPAWCGPHDCIAALPPDVPGRVREWLRALEAGGDAPRVAWCALVKYEVWPELISQLTSSGVPVHLFAAHVVARALPLRWWATTHRAAWRALSSVRVQDAESVGRLARIGVVAEVCGDPRFDRVLKVADAAVFPAELEPVRTWVAGRPCVVAGSTWPAEEGALAAWWPGEEVALIVAPHEVNEVHIAEVIATFPGASRFAQGGPFTGSVLVVDGIGWLSRLYALADVAVVGGGFGKGIHNVLEPAAHGVPTVVGPRTERFREAQQLERIGGLQRVRRPSELAASLANWLNDQAARQSAGASARAYSESGRGAGERIAVGLECAIDSLEKP